MHKVISLITFAVLLTYISFSQSTFTSVGGNYVGDWNDCNTWGTCPGSVRGVDYPGSGDTVNITAGDAITVTQNDTCHILSQSFDDSFVSSFSVNASDTLTIENRWSLSSSVASGNMNVTVNGQVDVGDKFRTFISHDDFIGSITVASGGKVNMDLSSGNNEVFLTGSNSIFTFQIEGDVDVDRTLVLNSSNGADITVNVLDHFNLGNGLTMAQSGAGATVLVDVDDTLTTRNIIFNVGGGSAADVEVDMNTSNSALFCSGTISVIGGGTIDASPTNTSSFVYNGTSAQTVALRSTFEYHDLIIANTHASGASLNTDLLTTYVRGGIVIEDNATFRSNGNNINLAGDWTVNPLGTFTQGANDTVNFAGSAAQVIAGSVTFTDDVVISNTSGAGVDLDAAVSATFQDLTIANNGNFSSNGANFNITGNLVDNGTFSMNSGDTAIFSGSAQQTIDGNIAFDAMQIANNAGVRLLSGSDSIDLGNLIINSGTFLDSDDKDFSVSGDWVNNAGTSGFTPDAGSRVRFSGSGVQSITGSDTTSFEDILIDNSKLASPWVSADAPLLLKGVLDVDDGQLNANNNLIFAINSLSSMGVLGDLSDGTPEATPISDSVFYQRFLQEYSGAHWNLVASPMVSSELAGWDDDTYTTGITGSDSATYPFVSISTWDESACGYTTPGDMSDSHNNGADESGWFVYANTGEILDLAGELRTGTVTMAGLTNTNSGGGCTDGDGWHLLGNPYAAHVFWDNVALTNIEGASGGTAHILKNDGTGDYVEMDHATPTDILSSGEAFFVQVSAGFAGTVEFDENDKTLSTTDAFNTVKLVGGAQEAVLKINMLADGSRSDFTRVALRKNVSEGYEWFNETSKYGNFNNYLNIATQVEHKKCSWNSIPDDVSDIKIPIMLYRQYGGVGSNHNFTLTFNNIEEFKSYNKCIVFEDSVMSTTTELTENGQEVSFSANDLGERRFFLNISSPLSLSAIDPTCYDHQDGFAIAEGSGSGPFNYIWKNVDGDTVQIAENMLGADTLIGASEGVYTVVVSGNDECGVVTGQVELLAPLSPQTSEVITSEVSCYGGSDGTAIIQATENNENKTFVWQSGNTDTLETGLSAGSYAVTITHSNGCSTTKSFVINEPASNIISKVITPVNCYGDQTGAISLGVPNTGDFNLMWSNGSTDNYLPALMEGMYYVSVTDTESGCIEIDSIQIVQPDAILSNEIVTGVTCFSDQDGMIQLNITGGVPPYLIDWNYNNEMLSNIDSLHGGTYTVQIKDQNNCLMIQDFEVTEPEQVIALYSMSADTVEVNESVIFDNETQGASQFNWSLGDGNISTLENPTHVYLNPGEYVVQLLASNANGCLDSSENIITVNDLSVSAFNVFDNTPLQILQIENEVRINTFFTNPISQLNVVVFNSIGQIVLNEATQNVAHGTITIELPQTSGIYTLQVSDGNDLIQSKRIFK